MEPVLRCEFLAFMYPSNTQFLGQQRIIVIYIYLWISSLLSFLSFHSVFIIHFSHPLHLSRYLFLFKRNSGGCVMVLSMCLVLFNGESDGNFDFFYLGQWLFWYRWNFLFNLDLIKIQRLQIFFSCKIRSIFF